MARLLRIFIKSLCVLFVLALLGFGGLIAWVATGPRSLDAFTPYIESALINPQGGYKVKIESSQLIWDGLTHPVGIRVRNVDVIDGTGVKVAHFPELGLRMYFFKLLMGKVDVKSIELLGPMVRLAQDAQGNITSFGFSSGDSHADAPIGAALAFLVSDEGDNPLAHLQSLIIRNASLSVDDSEGKAFLSSPAASLEVTRKRGSAHGKMRMPLRFGDDSGDIEETFDIDGKTRTVSADLIFSEIPSGVLRALAPSQQWMSGVDMPLSGWANMTSDFDAHIGSIDFKLDAGPGIVDFPDQFEKPLKLKHVALAGSLTQQLKLLTVQEATLDFGAVSLSFKGTVNRQGDDYGVDGDVQTANVPVDDVHYYWPLKLAPHSRHWVTTRLSAGKIVKASAALHFKPGDFKLKDTPEDAVVAPITVKGSTVLYKSGEPPITEVNGTVTFTGRTMDARITSAHYLTGTHITSGRARFPDFYPDDVRMFVELELTTTAKDVQKFLSLPSLNKAVRLNLTPQIAGDAKGSAKMDFIAFAENNKNDVSATGKINYAVDATLMNVAQNRFMGNRDIADADMKIMLDNKSVKASGKAKVNGVPMHIDLASSFGRGNETSYSIVTDMPVAKLSDFGLPKLDFASGTIGAEATFISSDTVEKSQAMLDLTHAALTLPQHGFAKGMGEKATLKLATERLPSGNTLISSFSFKAGDETASGKAEYDRSTQDFSNFSFSPLRVMNHDMDMLSYGRAGDTVSISGKGRVFDATPYVSGGDRNPDIAYKVNLQADQLILGDKRELDATVIEADCPADHCHSAHISAKLSDGSPFLYAISGGRLEASCGNAGELIRTLGIFNTLDGGKMSLSGEYKDGKLEGLLEMTDFTLKKASVLTKIFTIASLTGILDTLTGNGISFSKLSAPYVYHHGILILKNARTHGSALGLTADGMVDTGKKSLDLKGLLVPSYTMNALVGNIPLIGNWLMGGQDKGLVALSYGVHGDMNDPSINVNPLSVLTPGFLRDIFNIFDKPPPDMDAIEKVEKATAPAAAEEAPSPAAAPPASSPPLTSTLPQTNEMQK